MKKNILILLIIIAVSILTSYFFSLYIIISILEKQSFKFNIDMFLTYQNHNTFKPLFSVLLFGLMIGFIYLLVKLKVFGNSAILNRVDRVKSNMHGDAKFLTVDELNKLYGQKKLDKNGNIIYKEIIDKKDKQQKRVTIPLNKPYTMLTLSNSSFEGFIITAVATKKDMFFYGISKHHSLGIGTSGSGKSQYYLLPTIIANAKSKFKSSMFIFDLKGELFQKTSKTLDEQGYLTVALNLRVPSESIRYNPLALIWDFYHKWLDTNDIAYKDLSFSLLFDVVDQIIPEGESNDTYWNTGAKNILKGILIALLEDSETEEFNMTKDKFILAQLSNIINKQSKELEKWLTDRPTSSEVLNYAGLMVDKSASKTVDSFVITVQNYLSQFLDNGSSYITSSSDFDLDELIEKPSAFFLIIPDEDKSRYPLATLILTQIYKYLTFKANQRKEQSLERAWYFLLDEFGNMPKISDFSIWVSTSRSRNIYFLLILQAMSQLTNVYNQEDQKTIMTNLHHQMYLQTQDFDTTKYFQEKMGSYTTYSRNMSVNAETTTNLEYQGSVSLSKKDLVSLDELQTIRQGTQYSIILGSPLKGSLVPFFNTRMNKLGIFTPGQVEKENKIYSFNLNDYYYDLKMREVIYEDLQLDSFDNFSKLTETTNSNNFFVQEATEEIIKEDKHSKTKTLTDAEKFAEEMKKKYTQKEEKDD